MSVRNLELTTAQKRARDIYQKFQDQNGAPPSIRQFAKLLGVFPSAASRMLTRLQEKGAMVPRKIVERTVVTRTVTRLVINPHKKKRSA